MKYILVIDQGTTGTQVSLVNQEGVIVASHDEDFPQIYPQASWVEHDPMAIWNTVLKGIKSLLDQTSINKTDIEAIGITNQRETTVAWDLSGTPLYNGIVWQCRRTTKRCEQLKPYKKWLQKKTGLVNDPYFSATKMEWLLKNVDLIKQAQKKGTLRMGTIDSFLIYKLTGGKSFYTDVTNASRTLLMNVHYLNWDQDLLKLFKIPHFALPQILRSNDFYGVTQNIPPLPDGIPIRGVLGDQQSALFGQLAHQLGDAKITFGTGSFILVNSGHKLVYSKHGLLSTIAWFLKQDQKPVYALEGGAFICGAAVSWLRDHLKIISKSSEVEEKALQVDNSEGVIFIPALSGLGAPHWNPRARGVLMGLTRGTNVSHICRSVLEALAHQNVDILEAIEKDLKHKIRSIRVDGGASQNNLLMQLQSNFSQVKVLRPQQVETTTLGVAFMAGLGAGLWSSLDQINKLWKIDRTFIPQIKKDQMRSQRKIWLSSLKLFKTPSVLRSKEKGLI